MTTKELSLCNSGSHRVMESIMPSSPMPYTICQGISSVPAWISSHRRIVWCGDVFLVKMAPREFGAHAWTAYEDIGPEFMDLLANGPSGCW